MQKQIKKEDKNIKENVKLKNHFDQTKIFKKEAKEVEMIKKMQKQLKKEDKKIKENENKLHHINEIERLEKRAKGIKGFEEN